MAPLVLLLSLLLSSSDAGRTEELRPLLSSVAETEAVEFAELSDRSRLERLDLLVWDMRSRALPEEVTGPATIETVRAWVEDGGNLLLFSHATRWLHELGLESVEPDRNDVRLIGNRDAYSQGLYLYGVRAADPSHPLFRGLEAYEEHEDVFLLAGGHAVRNESCFWERRDPAQARVLGTFFRHGHGKDRGFAHRALVALEVGKGSVLAYGCGPLATVGNPCRENLARFVANAVGWLCDDDLPRIGVLPTLPAQLGIDEYSSSPPVPAVAPWPEQHVGPRLPYIAHWGWLGPIDYQRGEMRSADLDYFKEKIVDESARWGANLLEFYAPDMRHGFPWVWEKNDPLPRPEHFWGGAFDPLWDIARTRELTAHAHSRGFLVHSFHHPDPVKAPLTNYVTFTEWAAREFMNPRLHGWERAWDGFGWEWFPSDREGILASTLWKYSPGVYEHSTAVLPAYTPNFSGTLMCAFGRLGSLNACGFSDQWRPVYHAPLYLAYQADCRTKKPSLREWGGWGRYGGGSYPDWILRQVNDFCRARLHDDSAIWWLGEPESTLHEQYREYVYGITADPIRCAVACKLWATGRGGYRETIARLSPDPPPGFASGPELPMQTAILQNNYFRLVRYADRDGGQLLYDPLHLARFDPDVTGEERAIVLFEEEGDETADLDELVLQQAAPELPRRLAYEAEPDWPQLLTIPFEARVGRHRLLVELGDEERCFLEVRLDGEPIAFHASAGEGGADRLIGEFAVVREGAHELVVEAQSGGGVSLDTLELRRISSRAIRHSIIRAAGSQAVLLEEIADAGVTPVRRHVRSYTLTADRPMLTIGDYAGDAPFRRHFASKGMARWAAGEPERGTWLFARRGPPDPRSVTRGEWTLGLTSDLAALARFLDDGDLPASCVEDVSLMLEGPDSTRVFVRELDANGQAWWTQRGTQRTSSGHLVKAFACAEGGDESASRLHPAPFLPNGFRPGWGCQYVLAFEDVGEARGSCRVRVAKTGPFVFAPRIEFAEPLRSVTVDGEDWRYFEGGHVFLPSRRGDFDVRVETGGAPLPSVLQTRLTVTACHWDATENALHLETEAPSWFERPLPGDLEFYTVLIDLAGWTLTDVEGAAEIPLAEYPLRTAEDRETMGAAGTVLRLLPGKAVLRFAR